MSCNSVDLIVPGVLVTEDGSLLHSFVTQFCIGPWINMTVHVLRSVIAVVYSAVIVCLLAVLRSRKIFQNETEAKATRKHLQE